VADPEITLLCSFLLSPTMAKRMNPINSLIRMKAALTKTILIKIML
jgi:hypothetical protein